MDLRGLKVSKIVQAFGFHALIVFSSVYLVELLLYFFHFHTPLQPLLCMAKNSCTFLVH